MALIPPILELRCSHHVCTDDYVTIAFSVSHPSGVVPGSAVLYLRNSLLDGGAGSYSADIDANSRAFIERALAPHAAAVLARLAALAASILSASHMRVDVVLSTYETFETGGGRLIGAEGWITADILKIWAHWPAGGVMAAGARPPDRRVEPELAALLCEEETFAPLSREALENAYEMIVR